MITNREYTFYENKCENVYIGSNSWFIDYEPKPLSWWQCWVPEAVSFILLIKVVAVFWDAAKNTHSILFYTGGSF